MSLVLVVVTGKAIFKLTIAFFKKENYVLYHMLSGGSKMGGRVGCSTGHIDIIMGQNKLVPVSPSNSLLENKY